MKKFFSMKTAKDCGRWMAIFLAAIFIFSFAAKMFQSDFGRIKVEHILIDVRGAVMDGQLYYPAGTNSQDSLPAVVIAHGGGMNYGAMRGSAAEIARRGFVVLSLSAYGSSLSVMPAYDESGNGVEEFNLLGLEGASAGLLDAVDYVRSLAFVDKTRIGLLGQSMGANRVGSAAVLDCGYLTFNDIMINVLYEQFGQQFTEEEILMNADELAEQRLNPDKLEYYNSIRAAEYEDYNTRVKAVMVVGLNWLPPLSPSAEVEVAGHTVVRNVQTNVAYGTGTLDVWATLNQDETIKSTWYSEGDVTFGSWYSIDDLSQTSTIVGSFQDDSILDNSDLADALAAGTARVLCNPVKNITHTEICLSTGLYKQQTRFFEQALNYNNGDLTSGNAQAIDTNKTYGVSREVCNGLAMFSMFGFVIALACRLLKTNLFQSCVVSERETAFLPINKKRYWIMAVVTIILTVVAIYYVNQVLDGMALMDFLSLYLPFGQGTMLAFVFVLVMAMFTLIVMAVNSVLNKKEYGQTGLSALNLKIGIKSGLKSLLLAIIILASAYGTLSMIDYFFGQDYRYFTMYFSYVRPEYWIQLIPTMLIFFVAYLIIGCGINQTVRHDLEGWKDTVLTVVIYSVGIWGACLANEFAARIAGTHTAMFCDFMNTYHFNITVPLVILLSRVLYKKTKSVWLGAMVCAFLIAWSCTGSGLNDIYNPQTFLTVLFG